MFSDNYYSLRLFLSGRLKTNCLYVSKKGWIIKDDELRMKDVGCRMKDDIGRIMNNGLWIRDYGWRIKNKDEDWRK